MAEESDSRLPATGDDPTAPLSPIGDTSTSITVEYSNTSIRPQSENGTNLAPNANENENITASPSPSPSGTSSTVAFSNVKPQSKRNGTNEERKCLSPNANANENENENITSQKKEGQQDDDQQQEQPCEIKNGLKHALLRRQASLSVGEKAFLHALLVDPIVPPQQQRQSSAAVSDAKQEASSAASDVPSHKEQMSRAKSVLDDDVLFSLPFGGKGDELGNDKAGAKSQSVQPPRTRRNQSHHIGLWRAHEDGIGPKEIRRLASQKSSMMVGEKDENAELRRLKSRRASSQAPKSPVGEGDDLNEEGKDDDDARVSSFGDSIRSDEEIRRDKDDLSGASSWDLSEGGFDHYDAWAVLKDEYADDFGFSYRDGAGDGIPLPDSDEESDAAHLFKIIGTSADDVAAHPHVLSPPLIDSLLSFVPESLADQNLWLKFSLVRDGANLDILKRYVRAAPSTILAVETTNGDVFGAFTSSPWRQNAHYFGSGQSFLWKMRYNRMTPCHSLFEQAHLESEIDVYFYSGLNDYVQLCTADKLAVGGGELDTTGKEQHGNDVAGAPYVYLEEGENYGFGLAISDDLLHGTSSPCATFRNPCLVNHSSKGEVFEIVNLEVWAFTPCENVDAAEKLEMTKFFVQESVLSSISSLDSARFESGMHSRGTSMFSGSDLRQDDFYRRIGDTDVDDEVERMSWEYQNMLRPGGGNSMRSPYFASNGSSGAGDMGLHSPRMS